MKTNGRNAVYIISEEGKALGIGKIVTELSPIERDASTVVGPIKMMVSVRVTCKKMKERLGKWLGVMLNRRTTYKTIRRCCAKRNNFK